MKLNKILISRFKEQIIIEYDVEWIIMRLWLNKNEEELQF